MLIKSSRPTLRYVLLDLRLVLLLGFGVFEFAVVSTGFAAASIGFAAGYLVPLLTAPLRGPLPHENA